MKSAVGLLLFSALFLDPQSVTFDAASIKPSTADPHSSGVSTDGGLLRMTNVTLKRCIMGAYGVQEAQIVGGSKWIDDLRYDIIARSERAHGDSDLMAMLQPMLAERFRLTLHHDTQTFAGYALTVAKGGVRAMPSASDVRSSTSGSRSQIVATGCSISRLATRLSGLLSAPVVDMTEEKRKFDFTLQWTPDQMLTSGTPDGLSGPSLFTALQEQLGLKLESRKVPVDVLVIDHAEPASEN